MNHSDVSSTIANALLEIGAIKLEPHTPFTWSSGWKSPIYCDNRLSLSYPSTRDLIKNSLVSAINDRYPKAECVAGVATAGIPQGMLVADQLKLPFIYVRSKAKGHGMENMIEGKVTKGQKVVVVEDLISTGGSSMRAIEAIRNSGMEVLGLAAIFTYGFDIADINFKTAGVDYITLSNYRILLDEALDKNYISESQLNTLKTWNSDPANWKIQPGV